MVKVTEVKQQCDQAKPHEAHKFSLVGIPAIYACEGEPEPFKYEPTHVSIQDGSEAMESDLSGRGELFLVNEDGFEWQADPMEWKALKGGE